MKTLRIFAVLSLLALPALAQTNGPIAITSTQCATIGVSPFAAVVGVQVTGSWTGTLQPAATIQGQTSFNVLVTPSTSQTAQATITANGGFFALVAGYSTFRLCGASVSSGTATVFLNISGATAGGGAGATPFSYPLLAPSGSTASPSYSWSADTSLGFFRSGAGAIAIAYLSGTSFRFDANNQLFTLFGATPAICWNTTEICFTSNGAGIMRLGSTVTNNNGRLELGEVNIAQLCNVNSASPAACGTNLSGNIVIPTTTTTYTVNASKVQPNSRIFLTPSTNNASFTGTPTCVAPAAGTVTISAIVLGTSFTITLPSTAGQTCWNFWIVT